MKTFSLFIFSLLISIGYLSGADWNVQIARYKQDKACAISYTFDDGLAEHYTLLVPQLEKRGFRGTFWICGSNINKDAFSIYFYNQQWTISAFSLATSKLPASFLTGSFSIPVIFISQQSLRSYSVHRFL